MFCDGHLRCPAAMLFMSRDAYSVAQLLCFFLGYFATITRYVAKWGIAQICLCKAKYQEGYRTSWGGGKLTEEVSHDLRYHSNSLAISRDTGTPR